VGHWGIRERLTGLEYLTPDSRKLTPVARCRCLIPTHQVVLPMPARKPLQAPLFPVKPKAKLRTHAGQNLEAATIILTDPLKYGGEGSLMVLWARAVAGIEARSC